MWSHIVLIVTVHSDYLQRLSSEVCFRRILRSEGLILDSSERRDLEVLTWGLLLEEAACVFGAVVPVFKLRVVKFRRQ